MTNDECRMTKEPAKPVVYATLTGLAVAATTRLRPIVPEDYSERVREQAA
jgi:hypothetical protein